MKRMNHDAVRRGSAVLLVLWMLVFVSGCRNILPDPISRDAAKEASFARSSGMPEPDRSLAMQQDADVSAGSAEGTAAQADTGTAADNLAQANVGTTLSGSDASSEPGESGEPGEATAAGELFRAQEEATAGMPEGVPLPLDSVEIGAGGGQNDSLTLAAVGEVLFHSSVLNGGIDENGNYDYDYIFRFLKPEIERSDYAICDMEGTLAGPPYTGYPIFSAPDAVAKAMAYSDFDLAITANNHMLDRGEEGLDRTIRVLNDYGLETIGSRLDAATSPFVLKNINGINVAFSAYTWETIRQDDTYRSINGIPIPSSVEPRFDSFSQEDPYMAQDLQAVQARVQEMRAAGAELVVFLMHWGTEYTTEEDAYASVYTQALADAGCDLVISCGPHVIWPVRTVTSTDGSRKMLCYYSTGNIVSDQYYSIGDSNGRVEDGLIAVVRYERDETGAVHLAEAGYLATYCYKNVLYEDFSRNTIMPVRAALENPVEYDAVGIENLLEASLQRTLTAMENNTIEGIPFVEYTHLPENPGPPVIANEYIPWETTTETPPPTLPGGENVQGPIWITDSSDPVTEAIAETTAEATAPPPAA